MDKPDFVKRLLSIPVPTCCKDAQETPVVFLAVDGFTFNAFRDDAPANSDVALPVWCATRPSEIYDVRQRVAGPRPWNAIKPAVQFCPYCGTKLPEMQRKAAPPQPLQRFDHDGDYCLTCDEQATRCQCFPMEAAFEPK